MNPSTAKKRELLSTSQATSTKIKTQDTLNSPTLSVNLKTNTTTVQGSCNSMATPTPEKSNESRE